MPQWRGTGYCQFHIQFPATKSFLKGLVLAKTMCETRSEAHTRGNNIWCMLVLQANRAGGVLSYLGTVVPACSQAWIRAEPAFGRECE